MHFTSVAADDLASLLQLVDDDKQVGRTQVLLTDLFFRQQQQQHQQMQRSAPHREW